MYPEQKEYIESIISLLSGKGACLLEMPSGTGKTISLLSATISYQIYAKQTGQKPFKIIYCSRTVSEIEKSLVELKNLIAYIQTYFKETLEFLGVGLTSRNVLCINQEARSKPYSVDHACNKLIARLDKDCEYYLGLENMNTIPFGVYTLEDLQNFGTCNTVCPYFLSRKLLGMADCILFTYNYVIDPRIKSIVLKEVGFNSVVIFDEAHNIDNACIEAMSVDIKRSDLENAGKEMKLLENEMNKIRQENEELLKKEYQTMKDKQIEEQNGSIPYNHAIMMQNIEINKTLYNDMYNKEMQHTYFNNNINNNNILIKDYTNDTAEVRDTKNQEDDTNKNDASSKKSSTVEIDKEQINANNENTFFNLNYEFAPGNIRNSVHFISALKRILEFFKSKLKTTHLTTESTSSFCNSIRDLTLVDKKTLSFMSTRLGVLIRTMKVIDTDYVNIKKICDFATLSAQFDTGFSIIFEPFDSLASTVFSPALRLYCLDASIALKGVFSYKNVIITSGTLSPLPIYARILDFVPVLSKEISIQLENNCIGPLIITKGNDQMVMKVGDEKIEQNIFIADEASNKAMNNISSSYSLRNDPSVIRNYANLVIEFSKIVPDGLVVFFPSYIFMEEIISVWCEIHLMDEILTNKLVFIETPDIKETDIALTNYKKACENGRGAVLFSVARGKVSEGVDFKHEHGRCVIVLGVPYQYTESVRIKRRLEYLNTNYKIKPNEFLTFDAMRQAAQCLGRVIRGKNDYGLMIMADYRFDKSDKKTKLPKWILECLEQGNTNLSIDMAVCIAKRFYREMAQRTEY
ncbi:TFIIH/NER complex ATP-dependent 5'-3' DNA helicase subunit [Binucleata daphniae]